MEEAAARERSIRQGVLELIERNWDCVRRRMVFSFGVVGLVPSSENTKNKDLTPESVTPESARCFAPPRTFLTLLGTSDTLRPLYAIALAGGV